MNIRKKGTGSWCLCSWSISRRREPEAGAFVCGDHPPKGNRELVQLCMCSRLIFPKREPEVGTTVLVVNIPQKRTGSWYYCACVCGEFSPKENRKLVLVFLVNFPQKRTGSRYYCACVCGNFPKKEPEVGDTVCTFALDIHTKRTTILFLWDTRLQLHTQKRFQTCCKCPAGSAAELYKCRKSR